MKKRCLLCLALGLMIGLEASEARANITYNLMSYPSDQNGATLTGSITTDGTIGNLDESDILSWNWTITPIGGSPFSLSSSDAGTQTFIQNAVAASLTEITIAPGMTDPSNPESNVLAFLGSSSDLEWDHGGGPTTNLYFGMTPEGTIWGTQNPSMDGNVNWVIAISTAVPEPSSVLMLGTALVGLVAVYRRRIGSSI